MDVGFWILLAVSAGAAFAQGFSGFGYGILLMSGLSLLGAGLERASVFATLTSLVLVATLLVRSHRLMRVDWKAAAWVTAGIMLALPFGYRFILRHEDAPVFRVVFGLILVFFAVFRAVRPHVRRNISTLWAPVFGAGSGLLSGAFASGGPPVVLFLYAREDDPRRAVGTIQAVFLGGNLYRLAVILLGERGMTSDVLIPALALSPLVVLGTLAGFYASRRFSVRPFLLAVYGLLVLAGLVNILKGLS